MGSSKKKKPPAFVIWAIGLIALVAILGIAYRPFRTPRFLRGQRDRVSPVLKPAQLSDRNFFLVGSKYLLRLDPHQPSLRWKFDRLVRGQLEVSFFVFPKSGPVPPLKFTATVSAPRGRKRKVIQEAWRDRPADPIRREYSVKVVVPAGGEIELAAVPETAESWHNLDIGIAVPRIETGETAPRPIHVIIVSVDALRSDFLGVYQTLAGRPQAQSFSPELDGLAENAVIFRNARTTQAATWPALASLMLSRYPREHGVTRNLEFLAAADDSIAFLLLGRGYATTMLMANGYQLNIPGFEEKRQFSSDAELIKFARSKIASQSAVPFFHWYHLWGLHDNYAPPEWVMKIIESGNPDYRYRLYQTDAMMRGKMPCGPAEVEAVRRLYAGALYYVDSLLGTLFGDLKRQGLWDNALIIVTADHGEELFDHNDYFYHNPSLYDSALKIPLLIKFPNQRGPRVVNENVSVLDILPTLYDYFAGPPAPGRFSGFSLLDLLKGRRKAFRERTLFAECEDSTVVAALLGQYKLIYNPFEVSPLNRLDLPFPIAKMEFYDLRQDPGEIRNLAAVGHPVHRQLVAVAERFLQTAQGQRTKDARRGKVELTEEEKKEAEKTLRTLGYIH
jgi:arylsulfatase A-like enzyme